MNSDVWNEYVTHALHQTQETDRQPLGGSRPEYSAMHAGPVAADDDSAFKPKLSTSDQKGSGEDDEKNNQESGDTYNDQFARYLCQQLVKDIPDRFLGADSSDEEEEKRWMGELADDEFDIGDVISKENHLNPTPYNIREGDEETVSDDLESLPQQEVSSGDFIEDTPRVGSYSEDAAFSMAAVAAQVPVINDWADFSKAQFSNPTQSDSTSEDTKSNE